MTTFRWYFIALIILSIGCDTFKYKNKPSNLSEEITNKWLEAYQPNLAPMYAKVIKTKEQKKADEEYVTAMIAYYGGDTSKALAEAARSGWYYFYNNKIDTSMFRFNQCWLIDSTYPESYIGFAAIRELQGFKREAEYFYHMAYSTSKVDSIVLNSLHRIADIKEKQQDTTGLIIAYHRVLSRYPKDFIAPGKLGYFYSCLNKADSALMYYTLGIKNNPEYDQNYINRGWLYYQDGKYNDALTDYSTAIEKDNNSIRGYANRANVLMTIKLYKRAIDDLYQCVKLDPKHPNFHTSLAQCYYQLNQHNAACEELDNAIKLGDSYATRMKQDMCK